MNKMYLCSLLVAFLFFKFSNIDAKMTIEQMKNLAKPWAKNCANKVGLSPEILEAHRRGEFPEDEKFMCYLLCNCKLSKIIDKNDKVDLTSVESQLSVLTDETTTKRMMNVFQTCADQLTATEPCRLAWDYSKCYYALDKEIYMFS